MILMGSRYFFQDYEGYTSHDIDKIEIVDNNEFKNVRIIRGQGKDYFYFQKRSKEQWILDTLAAELPMAVGKFLIPEFNAQIGFTIEDLPRLKPQFDRLDEKHTYEQIIYDAYIANGDFVLTQEQRDAAYEEYKRTRK